MMKSNILERIIIKFITIFIILSIVAYVIDRTTTTTLERKIKQLNENRLEYAYNRFGPNVELLCLMSMCQTVYIHNLEKKYYLGYNRETNGFRTYLSEYKPNYIDLQQEYDTGKHAWYSLGANHDVVIKYPIEKVPRFDGDKIYIFASIILALSLTMSIVIVIIDTRFNKFKQSKSKNALNDQLRSELTESLHHELAGPISVVESNIRYFIKETIKCPYSKKNICHYYLSHQEIDECSKCKYRGLNIGERLSSTIVSLESMKSILCTMSHLKKMRYQRDNLNLSVILDSVSALNRINTYNVTTINVVDKELTGGYIVDGTLGDGVLFNSIMTLINNSNEAEATQIIITPKLVGSKMELYISDNGTGIVNSKGKIDKNPEKIFSYGYSTKEDFHSIKEKASLFSRFISILFSTGSTLTTSRGAGLSIAKKLLRENDGDISLVKTSTEGTVFKIVFPVKKKIYKE